MSINSLPLPTQLIERRIYLVRGHKVMIDSDLAELYQISTFRLNEAVKRNKKRFPEDFMFQLTKTESISLISQFAISKGKGGRRFLPYVFTEHGVAMLSSILKSSRAIDMNILIIRAFIKMRDLVANNKDFAIKIEQLEAKQKRQGSIISLIIEDIRKLKTSPSEFKKERIGFKISEEK